mmetsp:Transcript_8308/g.13889  ORF Transcript_8308/g.13889 Transcript_8308/m.13889 type:complete len:147 (+) Transcript_8308:596-1036(+)
MTLYAQMAQVPSKSDRNMTVCKVCGALQSAVDTEQRLQMHFDGKLHQGHLKIREKLKELQDSNRHEGRSRHVFTKSRSDVLRDQYKREQEEKLQAEAKDHFYYSSKKWGTGSNMPKLGSVDDQAKVKFSELVKKLNNENEQDLPTL